MSVAETPEASSREPVLGCPRCGHDLRGTPRDGEAGRCTECGLEFVWAELQAGWLHPPRWAVEGASSIVSWLLRVPAQLLMATFRPRAMLARLRMEHRPRLDVLLASVLLLALIPATVIAARVVLDYRTLGVPTTTAMRAALAPWSRSMVAWWAPFDIDPAGLDPVRSYYWDGDDTLYWEASDRWAQLAGSAPIESLPLRADGTYDFEQAPQYTLIPVREGHAIVLRDADWIPGEWAWRTEEDIPRLGPAEVTRIQSGQVPKRATPPLEMYFDVLWYQFDHAGEFIWTAMGLPIGVLAFAALPIARRRARVRWAHLMRLAGLAAISAAGLGAGLWGAVHAFDIRIEYSNDWVKTIVVDGGVPPAFAIPVSMILLGVIAVGPQFVLAAAWWSWAAGHYLRMTRPWAVGISVSAVATLVIPAFRIVVFGFG